MSKKIIYFIIILIAIGLLFYIFQIISTSKSVNEKGGTEIFSPIVVSDESTTTAIFKGYYSVIKGVYGEENTGPFDCPVFFVEKSDDPLFQFLAKWSPRTILNNGDMRLVIYLGENDGISTTTREKIIASTEDYPISITVQKIRFVGKGLPACGSVVRILSAQ